MFEEMELSSIKNRFGIIGSSPGLHHAIHIAERVAPTQLTVLITGESGVGKEVFSQIIHQLGARKHNPFIAVNCGAIPEGTIDSELFGHEKGAFTGAHESRKGYFETVNGGTIFLDEVGELPHGTQARLLRVLETGEYIRVGSSKVLKTDVRVVAATNVKLQDAVKSGRFREDLYYRLSTVPITIPSLRERGEDILLLFRKFCADFAERNRIQPIRLTDDARIMLLKYPWPGNVRQLKNVAEQVSLLASEREVDSDELLKVAPALNDVRLPAIQDFRQEAGSGFTEREILYKLIFDLKKDLNDLKQFVFDIAKAQVNTVPGSYSPPPAFDQFEPQDVLKAAVSGETTTIALPAAEGTKTGLLVSADDHHFTRHETVEESLSLMDKEKELIVKALKKHRNKRKDAAHDLGISERTLYRKIKEYQLE